MIVINIIRIKAGVHNPDNVFIDDFKIDQKYLFSVSLRIGILPVTNWSKSDLLVILF